ncbi:M56 family metallopeptidase [Nonlabens antarcticus]|uniref:M56 family metallopeptidase n=1 Tax=Nonlabens antarcticus TaxID=392714 RepID=UPI0018916BCA|nr:M56 family metallopeptidase [Nonlabens antarcticus]
MQQILINASVCLFSLWLVYKLLLENTSWHRFKRFYLLGAVVVSAVIPFLVVRTVVVPLELTAPRAFPQFEALETTVADSGFEWNWSLVLISVYIIGVMIMGFRFARNLYGLRIKSTDEISSYESYILVLRKLVEVPHSFFNRIYAAATDYKADNIPDSVLQHEKAHLDQKHSWDILILEILMVAMWFNPLLYLIKFSIKLNHEFLADQAVLSNGVDTKTYQETLLAYSANSQNRALANTFNFPIIKKRFTIMKTNTTTASGLLRSLAIVPVLALLVISCGQEEIVTEPEVIEIVEDVPIQLVDKKNRIFILTGQKNGTALVEGSEYSYKTEEGNIILYDDAGNIQDFQKRGYEIIKVDAINLKTEGAETIDVVEVIENFTVEDIARYNRLARKHASLIEEVGHSIYLKNETVHLVNIWKAMSDEQRAKAEPWPYLRFDGNKAGEIAPPPPAPLTALQYIEANKEDLIYYINNRKVGAATAIKTIKTIGQDKVEISKDANGKQSIKIKLSSDDMKLLPPPPPPPSRASMLKGVNNGSIVVYINGKIAREEHIEKLPSVFINGTFKSENRNGILYFYYDQKKQNELLESSKSKNKNLKQALNASVEKVSIDYAQVDRQDTITWKKSFAKSYNQIQKKNMKNGSWKDVEGFLKNGNSEY